MENEPNSPTVVSNGLPGIQALLSPSSQLPRLDEDQLKCLESNFQKNRNPSDLDIAIIAAEVGLEETPVR
ncbi:unnamed protein product, partial [Candidula unifasciata]